VGLALDPAGRLLIAEERGGRLLRLGAAGTLTPLASGLRLPRWLAVAPDGTVFLSARGLTRDAEPEPDDESAEPEMVLALGPDGAMRVLADGFRQLQGLAFGDGALFAATTGQGHEPRVTGVVYRIPLQPDGTAGPASPSGPDDRFRKPVGLARDHVGALFVTTRELDAEDDPARRAVAKLHSEARVSRFAWQLDDPQGLAFDARGHLYVADGRSGRVVRFGAPPPPALAPLPAFTARSPLAVAGTADAGARLDVRLDDSAGAVSAALADAAGAFSFPVELAPDAETVFEVLATPHGGDGLTSAPVRTAILHDGLAPSIAIQAPEAGAFVRRIVAVQVQAADAGSRVHALALTAGSVPLAVTLGPPPPTPSVTAQAAWDTTGTADGAHGLMVVAADRAGNVATISRTVFVDNTPPDTAITGGPAGPVSDATVTFTFSGTDNLAASQHLEFAWRLDGGPLGPFSRADTVTLTGLEPGVHAFEVAARDRAGNEDPTPARRSFTIGAGPTVIITDPIAGSTVPAGHLLVRGTVQTGGVEAGVAVNGSPAAVHEETFAALVPLAPGSIALTATATTADGATASHSIQVSVSPGPASSATLAALPERGVAPLTVAFTVLGVTASAAALDLEGDGSVDFTGPGLEGRTFVYPQPGLYAPTAAVTDATGARLTVRTLVQVRDGAALDGLLRARWTAMRSALASGDVEGALRYFAESHRSRFRTLFAALGGTLTQIAADMPDIQLVYAAERDAKYRIRRNQRYGGQLVTFTYYVYFVQDGAGLWVIESF
jgi:hypothetical protein